MYLNWKENFSLYYKNCKLEIEKTLQTVATKSVASCEVIVSEQKGTCLVWGTN